MKKKFENFLYENYNESFDDNPNVWMEKSREIVKKLNLCTAGSDSYGNFKEQLHKYEIVSEWMDTEFPSFSMKEYENKKYQVGHTNWYKMKEIKNGKFKIVIELYGHNSRLRFLSGVFDTNGYYYKNGDVDLNNLLDDYSIKPKPKSEEEVLWDKVAKEYYEYVDRTNGEGDFDQYFEYMKKLVKKTFKI